MATVSTVQIAARSSGRCQSRAMADTVSYVLDGHVATITYNRPHGAERHQRGAAGRPERRLRPVPGRGGRLGGHRDRARAGVLRRCRPARRCRSTGDFAGTFWEKPTINSFESGWEIFKPVIAAVNGYCLGYGLTLVTWCDFVIASDRARVRLPGGAARCAGRRRRDPPAGTDRLAVRDGAAAHRRAHRRRSGPRRSAWPAGSCPTTT